MKLVIYIIKPTDGYKEGQRVELLRDETLRLVRGGFAVYKAPENKKLVEGEIETAMLRTPSTGRKVTHTSAKSKKR